MALSTTTRSSFLNILLRLTNNHLRRRKREELLPLAPTILDAPVVLVALIAHISESQRTSIATVNGAQSVDAFVWK